MSIEFIISAVIGGIIIPLVTVLIGQISSLKTRLTVAEEQIKNLGSDKKDDRIILTSIRDALQALQTSVASLETTVRIELAGFKEDIKGIKERVAQLERK